MTDYEIVEDIPVHTKTSKYEEPIAKALEGHKVKVPGANCYMGISRIIRTRNLGDKIKAMTRNGNTYIIPVKEQPKGMTTEVTESPKPKGEEVPAIVQVHDSKGIEGF